MKANASPARILPVHAVSRAMTHRVETFVRASPEACFDAHRDLGLPVRSAAKTRERIVAGRTEGLLKLGELVTFEACHFGYRFRLTSKIVAFECPHCFIV